MKKWMDNALWGLLVALICIGLFLVAVTTTIVIKEVVLKKTPSAQSVEWECGSDCKQLPDLSIECECHPVK